MHTLAVTIAAAALSLTALTAPGDAQPTIAGAGPSIRVATGALEKIDYVACYGFGWRGWGVYPGWLRPACAGGAVYVAPGYVAPGYVAAAPVYPAPAPAYQTPHQCWVQTDPRGYGYWGAC
jgi:hypothetical protein